ncbi:MAG: carboxynorspermidine decarboxylase [Muribaculaceae bacterium]|nr:carboxynorspermidine decarboxylase [Muribaculaceae bacterium]
MNNSDFPSPAFVVYEDRILRNLRLITDVERRAGVNIIMAFKANALWKTFDIVRPYNRDFTASSLNELLLGGEYLGGEAHSYCPVYTDATIGEFLAHSSHITFNSLAQLSRYGALAKERGVSTGLRVNPQISLVETDIYNPSLPGSRFGVTADALPETLPANLDGFHVHCLCESSAEDTAMLIDAFETQFARFIPALKWVNFGGGHLMTRQGYDVELLVRTLSDFRARHPHLQVILEPGSAWMWRTGDLVTTVLDIVDNAGIKTAIIDASFACHMPDTLEMPYKPIVSEASDAGAYTYRLGGNSCLSGDFMGDWHFAEPLHVGQRLTLEDMNHYTTVKTTMFNGIQHPDLWLVRADGSRQLLRHFDYNDYKLRMD